MNPNSGLETLSLPLFFEFLGDESSNGSWSLARARERATGRIVAIQRAAKEADAAYRTRFETETTSARALSHPGLISVILAGRDAESGAVFCATESHNGVRLADRLALGPLVEADVHALARQLAEALAHAHSQRFALGGLSPQHILVTEDGTAKIRALGASRIGAPPTLVRADDPYLDRDATGAPCEASVAGDLRSLGKLLFHAATGEPPHSVALGLLPLWLRSIVAGCLDHAGEGRFQRGGDVVAALLPLVARFSLPPRDDGTTIDSLSITLSPTRRGAAATPAPSSERGSSDGAATPGSPFPWQPLDAQYDIDAPPKLGGMGSGSRAKDGATGRFVAIERSLASPRRSSMKKVAILGGAIITAAMLSAWLRNVVTDAVSENSVAIVESPPAIEGETKPANSESAGIPPHERKSEVAPTEAQQNKPIGEATPASATPPTTLPPELPTTPPVPPTAPPSDTTPPQIVFTSKDGAVFPERVVSYDSALLFLAKATDDVAVVDAKQEITSSGREPKEEPVSTIALRGGTTTELPLPTLGEHRLAITARDAAGNESTSTLVVERRAEFPSDLATLFRKVLPAPGSNLDAPNFELLLEVAPAFRSSRITLVASEGALEWSEPPKLEVGTIPITLSPSANRLVLTLRFEDEHYDAREVSLEYPFVRGRKPHADPKAFTLLKSAEREDSYPRRIRHEATGIEFVLVSDLALDGAAVAPFYVGAREVSISEYRAFSGSVGTRGGETLDRALSPSTRADAGFESPLPEWPEIEIDPKMPATFVSWEDANTFCREFGFRLLDEPRWRALAGRFRDDSLYVNLASSEANVTLKFDVSRHADGWPSLAPTSLFRADRRAIHCLWGNVAEWLETTSGGKARVAGGSWIDPSERVTANPIVEYDAAFKAAWIGFRVAFEPN